MEPPLKKTAISGGILVWFVNDLRIGDNKALSEATAAATNGSSVRAVFIVCPEELGEWSVAKIALLHANLRSLSEACADLAIALDIVLVEHLTEIPGAIEALCKRHSLDSCYTNRVADPTSLAYQEATLERSKEPKEGSVSSSKGSIHSNDEGSIHFRLFTDDQCIVPEGLLVTRSSGKPFVMFTPFCKAWTDWIRTNPISLAAAPRKMPLRRAADKDSTGMAWLEARVKGCKNEELHSHVLHAYPPGEQAALSRLSHWIEGFGNGYKESRDYPGKPEGTSRMSAYLALGIVSARQCLQAALKANHGRLDSGSAGLTTWIAELCWRDFYRHVAYHHSQVRQAAVPFKAESVNVPWRAWPPGADPDGEAAFKAWSAGTTGVPLVDAAMAQLRETGFMHNRLRMVVASYLTKHLLVHWRRGEEHFLHHLVDADWPSNNGGWQWAASTGTDAQPYFRIFNPVLQSERFDPDGAFIRQHLAALGQVTSAAIHDPSERLTREQYRKQCPDYPHPLVPHKFGRDRALAAFKAAFTKVK